MMKVEVETPQKGSYMGDVMVTLAKMEIAAILSVWNAASE
jgi:hypothetical protein